MDKKRLKFLILGLGILVSMGFLLIVGMNRPGGFAYYMTVSEFLQAPERHADSFRINGKVEQGSIVRQPSGQDVSFVMTDGATTLPVSFHGIIPDTFVDGADVVVEGQLQTDGNFEAHTLLAKCPSKYEAAAEEGKSHPESVSRDQEI